MTDLSDLISRVRAATGPDRELDAEIMFDLFATPVGRKYDGGPTGYLWPEDNPSWSFGIRFPGKDRTWFKDVRKRIDGETLVIERDGANVLMNALRIPKLTASLDAAIELCERVLPNARIKFDLDDSYARAEIWQGRGYAREKFLALHEDPNGEAALALTLAVLLAKQEIDAVALAEPNQ